MGRSMGAPSAEAPFDVEFRHARSGTVYRALFRNKALVFEAVRGGRRVTHTPAWAIGSGNQGKSYAISIQDALFQAPVSWYSARRTFDLSPGYETDAAPDFFRPITPECLFCHSGAIRWVRGTQNRYLNPPFQQTSIGCDRCHGDPSAHLGAPAKDSIVNPSRLPPDRRDAVCEQCHLSGEARIPNPGMDFSDYRPGMRLEDIFSVYVWQTPGDARGLKVVSHSEQLAVSRCFLSTGRKLWCGTCHDPHAESLDKASWFRGKCLACHNDEKAARHRNRAGDDCMGCHMPAKRAYDGGHTAFHDHSIRARATDSSMAPAGGLRAWREPPREVRNRNLGLAYVGAGSKHNDNKHLMEGYRLLERLQPGDGAMETARGSLLLRMGRTAPAVAAFRRAAEEKPADSSRRYNLAVALLAAGDRKGARENAGEAIRLEPLLEDAYALMAEIDPERAAEWKQRYRKMVPQRWLP